MRGARCAALFLTAACGGAAPDADLGRDTAAAAADPLAGPAVERAGASAAWPDSGAVDYRGERAVDLTGDGRHEAVIATARGTAYDSLDIAITIESAAGDTLWHEAWPSLLYFNYDPLEGKADTTVMRIVRDHVEELLAPDRFTMTGGLPAVLGRGGDPDATMREAVHYHLAELDYRRSADLTPADRTPPDAYSRISTETVLPERVDAVLEDLRESPSYMYYAGGEATYAIAWSDREESFVRIHSCC